tara:strand:- start:554 stop:727 length:174 start_codon:yes stop_codon:yes gene_type:complete
MITLKTECGKTKDLGISSECWELLTKETRRAIMLEFLEDNFDVFAYDENDEYTGYCL